MKGGDTIKLITEEELPYIRISDRIFRFRQQDIEDLILEKTW